MKYVEWVECDMEGREVIKRVTVEEAIAFAKKFYTYESDEQALQDFLIIQMADLVDGD